MRRKLTLVLSLVFLLNPVGGFAQKSDVDALNLLQDVAQRYAKATRCEIESVAETRRTGDFYSSWQKVMLTDDEAPGNRYRFAAVNDLGSSLAVSDGTTEWAFHAVYKEYVRRSAGTFVHLFSQTPTPIDGPLREAYALRRLLGFLGNQLKSAHWKPEEQVLIGNRKIDCLVVSFGTADDPTRDGSETFEEIVWIDKARKLIVKTEQVYDAKPWGAPYAPIQHTVETTVYPVMSLDEPIPDAVFAFSPPADAKLVDHFTDPMARFRLPSAPAQRSTSPQQSDSLAVGRPAPKLILTSADGKTLDVASLRGHPVLIDLWATWCGPCLMEMPTIDRIFRSAGPAGLSVVGIDEDKNPQDALAYMRKKNYGWPDYHYGKDDKYTVVALETKIVPTVLLIDADGVIAYVYAGMDDDPGLLAAVRHLGPAFSAAIDQAEK